MAQPKFFADVVSIKLKDRLSQLLGSSDDGMIEYRYEDAVRLAGHSCPTVAGAWLAAVNGLTALYPDEIPERGAVTVQLADGESEGVTGVIGQILTLVTGAAAANGFHGLGNDHQRSGLLQYNQSDVQGVRLIRNDTGKAVEVHYNPQAVAPNDEQMALASAVIGGIASDDQAQRFGELWQDRVRRILTEHNDDTSMIQVLEVA